MSNAYTATRVAYVISSIVATIGDLGISSSAFTAIFTIRSDELNPSPVMDHHACGETEGMVGYPRKLDKSNLLRMPCLMNI